MNRLAPGLRACAASILDSMADNHVVVGPLRWWRSSDGSRDLCFAVTRLLANGWPRTTWLHIQPKEHPGEISRLRVILALMRGPPLMVHVTEDEREWARLCEKLWANFDEQRQARRNSNPRSER